MKLKLILCPILFIALTLQSQASSKATIKCVDGSPEANLYQLLVNTNDETDDRVILNIPKNKPSDLYLVYSSHLNIAKLIKNKKRIPEGMLVFSVDDETITSPESFYELPSDVLILDVKRNLSNKKQFKATQIVTGNYGGITLKRPLICTENY